MISSTSLSAFSTPASIGAARPAERPHHPPAVQEARTQPKQQLPLQAQPDRPGTPPAPGQPLPRGSLLDLSV